MLVAITGANRGIGLALAKTYTQNGHQVAALCRHKSSELEALENTEIIEGVDVRDVTGDLEDLLKKRIGVPKVDVFINNAGIARKDSLQDLNLQNVREQFEVNSIGPLNMALKMLPYLSEAAKLGVVTSRMGSIQDNTTGGYYGYRMTKAAANAACRSLAIDLKERGITVAMLHPGYVKTDMTGHNGDITPEEAAKGIYSVMEKLSLESTGRFWHQNGSEIPW